MADNHRELFWWESGAEIDKRNLTGNLSWPFAPPEPPSAPPMPPFAPSLGTEFVHLVYSVVQSLDGPATTHPWAAAALAVLTPIAVSSMCMLVCFYRGSIGDCYREGCTAWLRWDDEPASGLAPDRALESHQDEHADVDSIDEETRADRRQEDSEDDASNGTEMMRPIDKTANQAKMCGVLAGVASKMETGECAGNLADEEDDGFDGKDGKDGNEEKEETGVGSGRTRSTHTSPGHNGGHNGGGHNGGGRKKRAKAVTISDALNMND